MTNIPWKQHFKTIIQRFLGIFNPDFFSYNQVDWGVIWYVHKYQIKLKNQKLLVHACATIWEASAVFKRCLTVSPDDQEFLFFMSLESLWRLLLVGKGVAEMIGRFVVDDTFFSALFSFLSLKFACGIQKFKGVLLFIEISTLIHILLIFNFCF